MWKPRVITTDAIPILLSNGGSIHYRASHSPNGWIWEPWATYADGKEEPVINSKTGEVRIFKSADAVVAFHMRVFPDAHEITLPAPRYSEDQKYDDTED